METHPDNAQIHEAMNKAIDFLQLNMDDKIVEINKLYREAGTGIGIAKNKSEKYDPDDISAHNKLNSLYMELVKPYRIGS